VSPSAAPQTTHGRVTRAAKGAHRNRVAEPSRLAAQRCLGTYPRVASGQRPRAPGRSVHPAPRKRGHGGCSWAAATAAAATIAARPATPGLHRRVEPRHPVAARVPEPSRQPLRFMAPEASQRQRTAPPVSTLGASAQNSFGHEPFAGQWEREAELAVTRAACRTHFRGIGALAPGRTPPRRSMLIPTFTATHQKRTRRHLLPQPSRRSGAQADQTGDENRAHHEHSERLVGEPADVGVAAEPAGADKHSDDHAHTDPRAGRGNVNNERGLAPAAAQPVQAAARGRRAGRQGRCGHARALAELEARLDDLTQISAEPPEVKALHAVPQQDRSTRQVGSGWLNGLRGGRPARRC